MALRISFELSDEDLAHFRKEMKRATDLREATDDETVIQAAETILAQVRTIPPDFVSHRLGRLKLLIDMVRDEGWAIPDAERARVIAALAYFANPNDLIPDEIPGLGYLDDAIMIELAVRALRHEIDAYEDFCSFRTAEATRLGKKASELAREDFIKQRRKELHSRMRRRRRSGRRRGSGGISSLDLFGG